MQAISVTNVATLLAAAGPREFIHIYNNSDTTIYLAYDGDAAAVTTANGIPIIAGATYQLNNDGIKPIFVRAVYAIVSGGVAKEVRVQGV